MSWGFDIAGRLPVLARAVKAAILLLGIAAIAIVVGLCAMAIARAMSGHFPFCSIGYILPTAIALAVKAVGGATGFGGVVELNVGR